MYYRRAGTHSDGVFHELTPNCSPGSLENVSASGAMRFVARTREPQSENGVWRIRCSESSDAAASESHSQLRHSAMDSDSPRDVYWHSQPGTAGIAPPSHRKCHVVSSGRGVW
jgi:hypothetical protein